MHNMALHLHDQASYKHGVKRQLLDSKLKFAIFDHISVSGDLPSCTSYSIGVYSDVSLW